MRPKSSKSAWMPARWFSAAARALPLLVISGLPIACAGDAFTGSPEIGQDASVLGTSPVPKNASPLGPVLDAGAVTEFLPEVSTEPSPSTEPRPAMDSGVTTPPMPTAAPMAPIADAGMNTTPGQELPPSLATDVAGVLDGYRLDVPCADAEAPDAGSRGRCPVAPEHDRQRHVLALGGDPNLTYAVELSVRGVAEVIPYLDFEERLSGRTVRGGTTTTLTESSFSMSVDVPMGTYFLNHRAGGGPFRVVNETFTFIVQGRTRVVLNVSGPPSTPDGQQRTNAGGDVAPGDDLGPQPYSGQFLQFRVLSVAVVPTSSM